MDEMDTWKWYAEASFFDEWKERCEGQRERKKERKKERERERETRDEPRNIANGMNDDVSIFAAVRVIMKRLVTKQYRKY